MTALFRRRRPLVSLADRGPLRVMFVLTSMPVGGAETLLVELIRRLDPARFLPELCCLKELGPLGAELAKTIPAHAGLLAHKYDVAVLQRLARLMARRRIDAVVTVGPGDKMFWGRLAARWAGVPVVCAAIHSTGVPDHVEWPNRLLASLTDAFIAVAGPHGRYLAEHEGCPAAKVRVIPNGVDAAKFHPRWPNGALRQTLGLPPGTPTAGIVAALRPEKNHELFLRAAAMVRAKLPEARFLVIGDGPRRAALETLAAELSLGQAVQFLGTRSDVPDLLALMDVLVLASHMEANPISILEAMAAEKPVISTRVGSVSETVLDGQTGYLVAPGATDELAARMIELLSDLQRAAVMGRAGRECVLAHWSIEQTVAGYQDLLEGIYTTKVGARDLGLAIAGSPGHSPGAFQVPSPQFPAPSPEPPAPGP
ncbi:MAG: glycosyltransferase [Thermoguttaceae bacterium]